MTIPQRFRIVARLSTNNEPMCRDILRAKAFTQSERKYAVDRLLNVRFK
jgi:hypothetical protein